MPTPYETSDKISKLLNEKKSAREFQIRKHADWDENYELNRNKTKTNRLTQRQAVNIPLMRETIKTLISKVDEAPSVNWREKSGDEMKELIYQEIWESNFKKNKLEWLDILDKKNVFLYGISTKKLNLSKKGVSVSVLDVYDVIFDPLMDPLNIESARFIVQQNIFRTLREVLTDDRYSKDGKEALKDWLASEKGIIQSGKNKEEWEKKNNRLKAMGVNSDQFALFAGGDAIVSITEHYTNIWNKQTKKYDRHVIVYADDCIELLDEKLVDLIGVNEWPFVVWSEDPETNDIYPDSIADLIRVPNKIINVWFSQQVENRTLQNFQMHWFDATVEGYTPQTYEPGPGRMLPAPGDPNKTIMPVQINGLDESFDAINFVTNIVERATGATALEKGQSEAGAQTLGEIQVLVGKATERAKTISKFYRGSWYDLAVKWDAIMQANDFPKFKLFRTGPDGKLYPKTVYNTDWKSEAGYEPDVASSSEQESDEIKNLQKFGVVLAQFPKNGALRKILQARQLKILDLTPAELKEVEDAEIQIEADANRPKPVDSTVAPAPQGAPQPQPQAQPLDLSNEISQLTQLMGQ